MLFFCASFHAAFTISMMILLCLLLGAFPVYSEIDQLNKCCYDARASYWDRFPFPEWLPAGIEAFSMAAEGKKALDIGSGTGRVASYLKNLGFEVLCIDPSSEMAGRCRKLGLKTELTTIQSFKTKERFGLIAAILSLIHVPKEQFPSQIEKIHSLLEPDGLFILSLLKGSAEGVEEQACGYPRFFARYTPQEIRDRLSLYFTELEYHERGQYMLFFFRKKELIQ